LVLPKFIFSVFDVLCGTWMNPVFGITAPPPSADLGYSENEWILRPRLGRLAPRSPLFARPVLETCPCRRSRCIITGSSAHNHCSTLAGQLNLMECLVPKTPPPPMFSALSSLPEYCNSLRLVPGIFRDIASGPRGKSDGLNNSDRP
jgi:hypothetical protein